MTVKVEVAGIENRLVAEQTASPPAKSREREKLWGWFPQQPEIRRVDFLNVVLFSWFLFVHYRQLFSDLWVVAAKYSFPLSSGTFTCLL